MRIEIEARAKAEADLLQIWYPTIRMHPGLLLEPLARSVQPKFPSWLHAVLEAADAGLLFRHSDLCCNQAST
jgi:hypothetical protein